jgi:hypothetical protein
MINASLAAYGVDSPAWSFDGEIEFRTTYRMTTLDEAVEDEQRRYKQRCARYERELRNGRIPEHPPYLPKVRAELEALVSKQDDGTLLYLDGHWPRIREGTRVFVRRAGGDAVEVTERVRRLAAFHRTMEERLDILLDDLVRDPQTLFRDVLRAIGAHAYDGELDFEPARKIKLRVDHGHEVRVVVWRPGDWGGWEKLLRLAQRQIDLRNAAAAGQEPSPVPIPIEAKRHELQLLRELVSACAEQMMKAAGK